MLRFTDHTDYFVGIITATFDENEVVKTLLYSGDEKRAWYPK